MRGKATVRATLPVPPEEVYPVWADMVGHTAWTRDLRRVDPEDDHHYRWTLHGPFGAMRWQAEVTIDRPGVGFAWCIQGPEIVGYTRVGLRALSERQTDMTVQRFIGLRHDAPDAMQAWWGDPTARLRSDVSHFLDHLRRRKEAKVLGRTLPSTVPMASAISRGP